MNDKKPFVEKNEYEYLGEDLYKVTVTINGNGALGSLKHRDVWQAIKEDTDLKLRDEQPAKPKPPLQLQNSILKDLTDKKFHGFFQPIQNRIERDALTRVINAVCTPPDPDREFYTRSYRIEKRHPSGDASVRVKVGHRSITNLLSTFSKSLTDLFEFTATEAKFITLLQFYEKSNDYARASELLSSWLTMATRITPQVSIAMFRAFKDFLAPLEYADALSKSRLNRVTEMVSDQVLQHGFGLLAMTVDANFGEESLMSATPPPPSIQDQQDPLRAYLKNESAMLLYFRIRGQNQSMSPGAVFDVSSFTDAELSNEPDVQHLIKDGRLRFIPPSVHPIPAPTVIQFMSSLGASMDKDALKDAKLLQQLAQVNPDLEWSDDYAKANGLVGLGTAEHPYRHKLTGAPPEAEKLPVSRPPDDVEPGFHLGHDTEGEEYGTDEWGPGVK